MAATTGNDVMMIRTEHGDDLPVHPAAGLTMAAPSDATGPSADPDEALLQAYVRTGDGRALEELLQRHLADCWRLALRGSGHPAEAEETLQRSWIGVMQQAARWRRQPQGSVRGWILGIVWNCERMRARESRRRAHWEHAAAQRSAMVPIPAQHPEHADLHAALAALPERYRQPVTLRFLEDLAFPEIAQVLGIPERTARTRVARAVKRLRTRLQPQQATAHLEAWLVGGAVAAPQTALPAAVRTALGATISAPLPSAAAGGAALAAWSAPALLCGLLGLMALWLIIAHHRGAVAAHAVDPEPTSASAAPPALAVLDSCEQSDDGSLGRALLDTPVTCQLYHVADLQALPACLPRGMILPLAWPVASADYLPWAGTTLIGQDTPLHRLINQACQDLGLRWQVRYRCIVVSLAMTPACAAAITAARQPPARPLAGAAALAAWRAELHAQSQQLACFRTQPALRVLLMRLGDADTEVATAARDALVRMVGTPWSTRRTGSAYTGLLDDPYLAAQVAHADRVAVIGAAPGWRKDPYLLYLHGLFPAPGDDRQLQAVLEQVAADAPQWPFLSASGRHHQQSLTCAAALACAEVVCRAPSGAYPHLRAALTAAAGAVSRPGQPPAVRTALALARARCGDASVLASLEALWRDPDQAIDVDLDADADGSAHALVDATVVAAEQFPDDRRLATLLVDLAVTDAGRPRRGAAATALVALRDVRCLAPLVRACSAHPAHVAEAMSAVIGMSLPDAVPALRALAATAPGADLAVLADGAALACGDGQAVPRLVRDLADPKRRQAALLMLCSPEHAQAIQALLADEAAHPGDGQVLQALAWSRHPLAIRRLVERLARQPTTGSVVAPMLIALLGGSHAPLAAQALAALIVRGGPLRPLAVQALQESQWPGLLPLLTATADLASSPPLPRADQLADPLEVWEGMRHLPPGSPDGAAALGATDSAFLDLPGTDARAFEASLPELVLHAARPEERAQALVALADLNDPLQRPEIVDCYRQALTDPDRQVRGTARAAMANARRYLLDGTLLQLGHLGVVADARAVAILARHLDTQETSAPAPASAPPPSPGF